MTQFIEVTSLSDGQKVLVNLDLIKRIYVTQGLIVVFEFNDNRYLPVVENYEEIKEHLTTTRNCCKRRLET